MRSDAVTDLRDQPRCPTDALGRSECAELLRTKMAAGTDDRPGCEITVSTARPLTRGPYTTDGFVCPHGVEYWIEPTGEQIADWAARGVR
jgi:hypothetical protein